VEGDELSVGGSFVCNRLRVRESLCAYREIGTGKGSVPTLMLTGGSVRVLRQGEESGMSVCEQVAAVEVVPAFVIELEPAREVVRLKPIGELDLAALPQMQDQVAELLAVGFEHLVIDLRGLSFIDTSGVSLLVKASQDARVGGWRLTLIPGDDRIQRLFALTRTTEQLPFVAVSG
jgi:anti-sigma B factor antagonist